MKELEDQFPILGEFFKDEIVHVAIPGMTNFLGSIDLNPHPLGLGWIRIINPVIMIETVEKGQKGWSISTLGGPYYHYREYVDFFAPIDRPMEIRTLHPDGNLCKQYWREVRTPKRDKILAPGDLPFDGTPFQQ